jgi:prolyl oligopeptidase
MPLLMDSPPHTEVEMVTETLHGVTVSDPYRWLEDRNSARTQAWVEGQTRYARAYLDRIPGRERIRERVCELLDVETYDSVFGNGSHYFFRKRLPGEEQSCIYMRDVASGEDRLLLDPAALGKSIYTAVKPLRVSPDGQLLLYEIKEGGERTGRFAILDLHNGQTLPDVLPRGYLRGFAFAPGGRSFYYVHESPEDLKPFRRAAFHHFLGTSFAEDREIFVAGEDKNLRLCLLTDGKRLGFLVHRFLGRVRTDLYWRPMEGPGHMEPLVRSAEYLFSPVLMHNRVFAATDRDAPNLRIVELRHRKRKAPEWVEVVPESDTAICQWLVVGDRVCVSRIQGTKAGVSLFDFSGRKTSELPIRAGETVRLIGGSHENTELLFETESFMEPVSIWRYSEKIGKRVLWAKRCVPFGSGNYGHTQVWSTSKDGTRVPMSLVGRRDLLAGGNHPVIMTSYGGFGVSVTPQFSVFVAFLMERGCLFALPHIRGGSEFGVAWHEAAKKHSRQNAHDDFLGAAEWLIAAGRAWPEKFAIFGGSNSGLLVAAAMTQRPDLFRTVLCMVPMLDMLRYHLFDNAHVWREEFGSADDLDDFLALANYSPYHQVRSGTAYPATMIVSGDADQNCNPLHARKMTARLQAANSSGYPILLDYSRFRGHSPVLPLRERINALTDRLAFLCDQLQLPV